MRRALYPAGILLLTSTVLSAGSYIVTTGGDGIRAAKTRTGTVMLYYRVQEDDEERMLALSGVADIVPTVDRGHEYSKQEADDALAKIGALLRKFLRLRKELIILQQQWEAVRNPDTGTAWQIDVLLKQFESSASKADTFRDVCLQLDMLRFKDIQGRYTNQIEAAIGKMRVELFDVEKARVERMVQGEQTVSGYLACKRTVDLLKMCSLPTAQKQVLDDMLLKYRDATVAARYNTARSTFLNGKSVDSYLAGAEVLRELLGAMSEDQKVAADVDRVILSLRKAAGQACAGYDFSFKGYPLSGEDTRCLASTRQFASSVPVQSMQVDEQAYVFPARIPNLAVSGGLLNVPVRIVFNRPQPGGRVFAMVNELTMADGKTQVTLWRMQDPVTVKNGRADVNLAASVPSSGVVAAAMFLAYRPEGQKNGAGEEWIAASLGCPLMEDGRFR